MGRQLKPVVVSDAGESLSCAIVLLHTHFQANG